jgi:hypothetical protein
MNSVVIQASTRPIATAQAKRACATKPTGRVQQRNAKLALPMTLAMGTTTFASDARAQDAMYTLGSQLTQLAEVPTPLLYFGFLTTSLTFAAGTYIALSKIKLI